MKVYCVIISMHYEDSTIISIHKTLKGAEKVVRNLVSSSYWAEEAEEDDYNGYLYIHGYNESYYVKEMEVEE